MLQTRVMADRFNLHQARAFPLVCIAANLCPPGCAEAWLIARVLGIFAVVGLGTLFGPLGVLFASPPALVVYVAVTTLCRQNVLHDEEAVRPVRRP